MKEAKSKKTVSHQRREEYSAVLIQYLKTGQEAPLYHIAQLGKEMMNKGMGPESIVELHLDALKKTNKAEKTYPKKAIDDSFTVLMEGIMSYGMAYKEFFNSRTEGYLAEIRDLNRMLSERLAAMTALYETVKATVSSLDLDEVLSSVFNNAVKTLKADEGSLMLLDPEEGILTIKKAHGLDEEIIRKTRIKIGEGIAGMVAQSGETMVFHGRADSPQVKGRMKYDKVNSICTPLKTKKGVIGILNLNRQADSEPFTEDNLKLLSTMAHEAASAIENANLFEEIQKELNERKRAEVALRESEDKYRSLVNNIKLGIFRSTPGPYGKFIEFNLAMEEITGYSREELLSMNVSDLYVRPEEREIVVQEVATPTGKTTKELNFRKKDGTEIMVSDTKLAVRDNTGKVLYFDGIIEDVAERQKAEKEKRSLEEQFRQSQKMEAIGRLAGGIAHDFNNLLTVMKGRSQLALMELKEGDPLRESFKAIENATTKSANLVRQILAFSRRQVMEMIVLDLNNLLRDLEKMLHRIIGEDIEFLIVLADDLGRVKTDPGQIEQVVFNLAVNARDAMPQGGKLTIETANVELDGAYARRHVAVTPGRYVMVAVSDTGVGMTPEIRERVFEPFFTTKEKGKGTGLGLATVYGIVKQSGGNIWVYSEPGQGTVFKIYLPRVDEPLTEEGEKEEIGLFRGVGVILVVEDEEGVRKLVLEMLKKQGYSVLEAANEEEALLICRQYKDTIHLMVTDVVMPGISGPELAKRLVVIHPEMKVLYMSGYADNAIVHHGVLKEGVNFIQKPFTIEGLAKKVREVLDKDTKPAN